LERLFAGLREELATCQKFATVARTYATARLETDIGLWVNEARMLDLDDVRWDLGRSGKPNVRYGKGARRKGPEPRLVSLPGKRRTLPVTASAIRKSAFPRPTAHAPGTPPNQEKRGGQGYSPQRARLRHRSRSRTEGLAN